MNLEVQKGQQGRGTEMASKITSWKEARRATKGVVDAVEGLFLFGPISSESVAEYVDDTITYLEEIIGAADDLREVVKFLRERRAKWEKKQSPGV